MAQRYDVIVIGSGFGGAVVAARLAEAGRNVCVLERGRRWSPAEYPRTFSQAEAAVWDEQQNYGFLEYRVFRRIDVVQGVGVGGGSLHYFNVQMRAPHVIFERPEWPAALRGETLDPYYERAEGVIESGPLTSPPGEQMPPRTHAFLRAANRAGYDGQLVPIAIHAGATRNHPLSGVTQQPCTYTADCLLGCRVGAKNSLDLTYIPMGERHGLEIKPLHVAERIDPDNESGADGSSGEHGYVVTARALDPDHPSSFSRVQLTCRTLVLSAGVLGSTELLLRARHLHQSLPGLPASVGRRFSGNGDMLFAGTQNADQMVDPSQGPSITAGAFVQPPGSRHLIQLQDLGYPPALTGVFDGVLPTPSRVRSAVQAAAGYVRAARGNGAGFPASKLFAGSFVPTFLPYLGMGTDAGDGCLRLDRQGRLAIDWNPSASKAMFDEMEAAMRGFSRALGGSFVRSLPWRRPFRRLLTAHPLGGCVMSEAPDAGVVDHRGQVWGHPGLYVADGSVIPGPLAVNPSLTIAAVAERIAQWMIHEKEAN